MIIMKLNNILASLVCAIIGVLVGIIVSLCMANIMILLGAALHQADFFEGLSFISIIYGSPIFIIVGTIGGIIYAQKHIK